MSFRSRMVDLARGVRVGLQGRAYAPATPSGYGGWMGSIGGAVREPFAGAWQKNVTGSHAGIYTAANSAVFTCNNVISSDMSTLPVQIMRPNTTTGVPEPHYNHPAWALFQNPNPTQTLAQFIQQYMVSKLTHGNTYVLLIRDARYVVNEMYVLDPYCVQPLVADDGSVFYRIGKNSLAGVSTDVTVPARDIVHDRYTTFTQLHPLVGVAPLFAACVSAALSGEIQMTMQQFFANMAIPSGFLVAPGKIEKTISRQLQQEWEANYSGKGIGRTAVLTNGLDYKALSVKPVDTDMVQLLRYSVEDIARCYRVPPYMVGELSKATYRNSEQMSRDYFSKCLAKQINDIEQCFTKALGMTGGVEVKFDLTELFRMEADVRFANYQIALNAGFFSINEVRAMENMQPVPNGDTPRVQMQYVPLALADKLAEAQLKPAPAPTPAPAPAPPSKAVEDLSQFELIFDDPDQMSLLSDAFGEHFDLGENNGA